MAKFRKKPVVIEAFQYRAGTEFYDWPDWASGELKHEMGGLVVSRDGNPERRITSFGDKLEITTLEGVMVASHGDWIIRGVKGELYPCKPDIFAATYEPVSG
ncbi:MAG TPA: hypothetical protein VEC14_04745 [Reyranellaceae bacterium]|nr:hypothetical protein [Reyranellaceae bacterium]